MEFRRNWGIASKKAVFVNMYRLAYFLVIAVMLAATAVKASAQSGYVMQPQADWLGNPCLVTNPAGPVHLVFNPNQYAADAVYRNKTDALALQASAASIPSGDAFAPAADAAKTTTENKRVVAQLQSILHSAGLGNSAARTPAAQAQGQPAAAADSAVASMSLSFFIQRWLLFSAVVFFLTRRVWRYFHEVEEDDDFADHLGTLAMGHRWIFPVYMALLAAVAAAEFFQFGNLIFSLSVLMLAASVRRYYCESDFADYPRAQKIHLALSLLLIWQSLHTPHADYLTSLSAWFHWPVVNWVLLTLATRLFSGFYNDWDLTKHRNTMAFFLGCIALCGGIGGTFGYMTWSKGGYQGDPWRAAFAFGLLACFPVLFLFFRWWYRISEERLDGKFFDLVFGDAPQKRKKHLPEILLLQHWRQHGDVEKAWQTAQSHLFKEARALSVWLFAMETAVLYRRQPGDALDILKRLCVTEEFHYDHRTVAVTKMQGWMAAAGFKFDVGQFKLERPPLQPTKLTNRVEQMCREGQFGEAAILLRDVLEKDCLNEPAFIQLVRLHAQDLKNRPAAERLIAEASETFSPNLLDFLNRSLDEWMRQPIRSTAKPRTFLGWLFRRNQTEPSSRKFIVQNNHAAPPPKSTDPLEIYLNKVKQNQPAPPDTSGVQDKVEKLLIERRLGSAIELLKEQAEAEPENFDLWLRYAEAHGNHCGNALSAEKIIQRMDRSGHFKKAQMRKANSHLKKWWKKHPTRRFGW